MNNFYTTVIRYKTTKLIKYDYYLARFLILLMTNFFPITDMFTQHATNFWTLFRLMTNKIQSQFNLAGNRRKSVSRKAFDKTVSYQAIVGE